MFVQLIKRTRLAVNPVEISAMFIYTVNHAPTLEVRMRNGEIYRVPHTPHCHDGDNVYELHQRLMDFKLSKQDGAACAAASAED